jgi:hypothetical protein
MKLRTRQISVEIEAEGHSFTMQELGTTALTEVALATRENMVLAMRETFIRACVAWSIDNPCTKKEKGLVFEAHPHLMETVMEEFQARVDQIKDEEKKIYQPGHDGTSSQVASPAASAAG